MLLGHPWLLSMSCVMHVTFMSVHFFVMKLKPQHTTQRGGKIVSLQERGVFGLPPTAVDLQNALLTYLLSKFTLCDLTFQRG